MSADQIFVWVLVGLSVAAVVGVAIHSRLSKAGTPPPPEPGAPEPTASSQPAPRRTTGASRKQR
ncbi:MAG: hypothetical protein AB7O67_21805 [Vicinamibacterales bacterium]